MPSLRAILKAAVLAGLVVASPAIAQEPAPGPAPEPTHELAQELAPPPTPEMKLPRISISEVDWTSVRTALASFDTLASHDNETDVLTRLNAVTAKAFADIATSPVPVLLPFDTTAYLRDAAQGNGAQANSAQANAGDVAKYLSGFTSVPIFFPGPSGYDALISLRPGTPGLNLSFAKPVEVEMTGSAFVYELDGPAIPQGVPVPQLDTQFPGIRRSLVESRVRYTFVRFGVPYVVAILCFDGPPSARRLSCREADKVALRFLGALNIVGGAPQAGAPSLEPRTIDRPAAVSPDFTYFAPGDLIPGTGVHGQSGRADSTVYAKIRFPLAQPPAYAVSQSFMNWGNCDLTGRVGLDGRGDNGTYHCKVNDKPLVNDESKNFAYPWRDNFCEHRTYEVGQCPAGVGHQGQDIRPATCLERDPAAGRCEPYQEDVVAVSDGVLMRSPGDLALYLLINKPGEHIRVRYLHMNPKMLDIAGMVSGRKVVEGEVLGAVGEYGSSESGTSYHLHFDAQLPTRAGWVFFNPYMTLVASYERLIGARGQVINDTKVASSPPADTAKSAAAPAVTTADAPKLPSPDAIVVPEKESPPVKQAKSDSTSTEHCTTVVYRRHRRLVCHSDVAGTAAGGDRVRSVDGSVSEQSHRARHRGRYVHAHHAGTSS
jgi:murein DD-endopeptidase MepM/ murein hydrolase activator NlpD